MKYSLSVAVAIVLTFFGGLGILAYLQPKTTPTVVTVDSQRVEQALESTRDLEQRMGVAEAAITELQNAPDSLGATNAIPTPIALFETSLANKINSSATSMTLVSSLDKTGTALASSTYGFIIDEGTASEEMVLADCTATVCTNMTRGISPITGTTTVAALQFEHRRGSSVKITNGPQLLILSRIVAGIGTFPSLLAYTSGTACSVSSPNSTICDKAYIDGVAVAGASNANQTTKGIVEIATKLEAASSTNFGGTGAWLALGADIATDTPNTLTRASRVLMSDMTGFLTQSWLNLTANFAWTGTHTFNGTSGKVGIGTTSPYLPLSTEGSVVFGATTTSSTFFATSTNATSTFSGGFVSGTASSTNLSTNNACLGCIAGNGKGYVIWQGALNCSGGGGPNPTTGGSISCPAGKVVVGGGYSNSQVSSVTVNGPTSTSTWTVTANCTNGQTTAGTAYAVCLNP